MVYYSIITLFSGKRIMVIIFRRFIHHSVRKKRWVKSGYRSQIKKWSWLNVVMLMDFVMGMGLTHGVVIKGFIVQMIVRLEQQNVVVYYVLSIRQL